jgi:two-component system, OmpR family, response regulator RegX3
MANILVVEDEVSLAETVAYNLQAEGFRVQVAHDGPMALARFRETKPDLVILDIMLPGLDGIEVCKRIRKDSDVPVIMLTAKAREIDKVVGLEVGADDYVTKPFGMMELIARVRAALRRTTKPTETEPVLARHGVQLDVSRHQVTVDGQIVEMRPKEFDLLRMLMTNAGRVVDRSSLLDAVWGEDEFIDTRTLDVHVRRLRQKMEIDAGNPTRVLTVRGIGYKFAE